MSGYLVNFIIYTMAMIGLIFIALMVYKKTSIMPGAKGKSKFLGVEDVMSLTPRKSLYVVRAGNERFLIASDMERTTLISKLGETENIKPQIHSSVVEDLPNIAEFQPRNKAVLKEMVKKINM